MQALITKSMTAKIGDGLARAEQGQATVVVTPVNGSANGGANGGACSDHDESDAALTDVENDDKNQQAIESEVGEADEEYNSRGRAMGRIVGTLQVSFHLYVNAYSSNYIYIHTYNFCHFEECFNYSEGADAWRTSVSYQLISVYVDLNWFTKLSN